MTTPAFRVEHAPKRRSRSRLMTVRLNLGREPGFPDGSDRRGYILVAPLDKNGVLDPSLWRKERARCHVTRFWEGEPAQFGVLKHSAGGASGARWLFDFDPERSDDDEAGHRLDLHHFRVGDYVTIDHDGEPHVFRVARVDPLTSETALNPTAA